MPRSPFKNLLIVLSLLAVMAGAVILVTGNQHRAATSAMISPQDSEQPASTYVRVGVHVLFSHRPQRVVIEGYGIDIRPEQNSLQFTLDLPTGQTLELPLDVIWEAAPEDADSCYFTRTTTRQNNKEDNITHFVTHDDALADVLTINTHD